MTRQTARLPLPPYAVGPAASGRWAHRTPARTLHESTGVGLLPHHPRSQCGMRPTQAGRYVSLRETLGFPAPTGRRPVHRSSERTLAVHACVGGLAGLASVSRRRSRGRGGHLPIAGSAGEAPAVAPVVCGPYRLEGRGPLRRDRRYAGPSNRVEAAQGVGQLARHRHVGVGPAGDSTSEPAIMASKAGAASATCLRRRRASAGETRSPACPTDSPLASCPKASTPTRVRHFG